MDIEKELIQLVRKDIGPVAAFKKVICLPFLPKVRFEMRTALPSNR